MTDLLRWATIQVNRRRFLRKIAALSFAAFAGAAVGKPQFSEASVPYCTGISGSGWCGSSNCNGSSCVDGSGMHCVHVYGRCTGGGSCWEIDEGVSCCDCHCREANGGVIGYYCFCTGA